MIKESYTNNYFDIYYYYLECESNLPSNDGTDVRRHSPKVDTKRAIRAPYRTDTSQFLRGFPSVEHD